MSSFSYLKHLPVDYIKIDGSLVREMLDNKIDRAMVEMIVRMARVLGKEPVAECVESEDILAALCEIGVGYAQGYAFGKPEPFEIVCRSSQVFVARSVARCDHAQDSGGLSSLVAGTMRGLPNH